MRNITIELEDLQRVIAHLYELDIDGRMYRVAMNEVVKAKSSITRSQYAALLRDVKLKAEEDTLPRYRFLIDALHGDDDAAIRDQLQKFARRAKP